MFRARKDHATDWFLRARNVNEVGIEIYSFVTTSSKFKITLVIAV